MKTRTIFWGVLAFAVVVGTLRAGGMAGAASPPVTTPATGGLPQCQADLNSCTANLGTCNTNLSQAQTNLGSCTTTLGTCTTDLAQAQANLTTATNNLNSCTSSLNAATSTLNTCTSNLNTATSTLNSCTSNLNTATSTLNSCTSNLNTATSTLNTCTTSLGSCNASLTQTQADLEACQEFASPSHSAPYRPLLATGQAISYLARKTGDDTPGPVPVPDDGALRMGTARMGFQDNGDGTLTDRTTGLVWEKKCGLGCPDLLHASYIPYRWTATDEDGGPGMTVPEWLAADRSFFLANRSRAPSIWDWLDAINAEGGTGFAGYNDWRIPNYLELLSLLTLEQFPTQFDSRGVFDTLLLVSPEFNVVDDTGGFRPEEACQIRGVCNSVLHCSCTAFGLGPGITELGSNYWSSTILHRRLSTSDAVDAQIHFPFTVGFDHGGTPVQPVLAALSPLNEVRAVRGRGPVLVPR